MFVRNFSPQHPHSKWLFSQIFDIRGPNRYTVQLYNHRVVHGHIDHIRHCTLTEPLTHSFTESEFPDDLFDDLTARPPVSSYLVPLHHSKDLTEMAESPTGGFHSKEGGVF